MFELPEDLTALDAAALAELETQALAAFEALGAVDEDDLTDEQVTQMEALADAVTQVHAAQSALTEAASARRERAAAARAAVAQPEGDQEPGESEVVDDEPQQVAASGAKGGSVVRKVARKAPVVPTRGTPNGVTLIAAADVPGIAAGSEMEDLRSVAHAFTKRMKVFPQTLNPVQGIFNRYGVASIAKEFKDGLVDTNPAYETTQDLVAAAGTESRLQGGSLIASGGWCAPSETFYDLCTTETLEGLIDIPEMGVSRGGIRFTKGPNFETIYANEGFVQTEAQAIAGTTKDCFEVQCPDFQEVRLDAIGLCVRAPLLTKAGYPELVQRWIEGSLIAHQHKVSARVIAQMAAIAGTAFNTGGAVAGLSLDMLGSLEWIAETMRYRWRMSFNATMELVIPHWVLSIVRQDMALRSGRTTGDVSDAEVQAAFAARKVRPQWVYDWQPLNTTGGTGGVNKFNAPLPATFNVLAYPAGAFVKGTSDVITLDAVYDTTSLQQNMYTAAFVEEGLLVANRCYDAAQFTFHTKVQGKTGTSLAAADVWTPTRP